MSCHTKMAGVPLAFQGRFEQCLALRRELVPRSVAEEESGVREESGLYHSDTK